MEEVVMPGEWLVHRRREVVLPGEGLQQQQQSGPQNTKNTMIDSGSLNVTKDEEEEEKLGKNSVYFDNDTDSADEWSLSKTIPGIAESDDKPENLDIQEVQSSKSPEKSHEEENKPSFPVAKGKKKHVKFDLIEESDEDEDVIELEFEREIKKLDTHTMYCPNCNTSITKVILRKKQVKKKTPANTRQYKPVDLLGCFSCFSVFVPSGNCFNWIRLTGHGGENDGAEIPQQRIPKDANVSATSLSRDENNMVTEQGDCFSLFGIFGNKPEEKIMQKSQQESSDSGDDNGDTPTEQGNKHKQNVKPKLIGAQDLPEDCKIDVDKVKDEITPGATFSTKPAREMPEDNGTNVDKAGTSSGIKNDSAVQRPGNLPDVQSTKSLEILKSVVYGGLMESITSLSVVSSAAASGATTLNIIAIGLANLIGGLFILGPNLRDLKNDTSEGASNKYQDQLGVKENFLIHATFVVLSFLVFGLIPPATYGFAFHKTNDEDLTIIAVAVAAFLCIILLAIGKAYIGRVPKFYEYIKTIMYYISLAVMVSGVSYAAGDLAKRVTEKFGWFETASAITLSLPDTKSTNPVNWASY